MPHAGRHPDPGPSPGDLIGAVLAGGRSRRMGADKAHLLLPAAPTPAAADALPTTPGETLLARMTTLLQHAGVYRVVICGEPHGIADRIPGMGPLGALHALCHHYPDIRALVVPVDMPGLDVATLRALTTDPDDARARHFAGYPLPLLLRLSAALRRDLERTLTTAGADRSLQALLRRLEARTLAAPRDCAPFANLNTPRDWQLFIARQPPSG